MIWNFDQFSDHTALVTESGNEISYSNLSLASNKLAEKIYDRCLVFILCKNELGSLLGYVTFLNHRIVPFLVEADMDEALLKSLIDTYKPDYLWSPSNMGDIFLNYHKVYSDFDYSLIKTDNEKVYPLYSELALLLTTSGSTGSPKLVRQSYTNIQANTLSIVNYLKLDSTDRVITTLPMSYTYGISIINTHLYVGASIIMTKKTLMQREFWQQFKDFHATSFGGVPYIYEMLDKLKFFRMTLPSLRQMTQAGGKLSAELHKKFAEHALEKNINFMVMYGQTEATARMSYLPANKTHEKYGSIGIAIPGGKFSLVDKDKNIINKDDIVGELIYQGDNVTLGYAECGNDLSKGDCSKGILETGDLAKRDADGYYYIVGRKKRFLKIYGTRINLDEIESMIKSELPEVMCACAGEDDKLYIFLTEEKLEEKVKNILDKKIKLNSSAIKLQVIDKIPQSESGKTLYSLLTPYYENTF